MDKEDILMFVKVFGVIGLVALIEFIVFGTALWAGWIIVETAFFSHM